MCQKHVVITLTPRPRRISSHLVLHLLDSCSVWHPRSCFPELYDSAYKYFIRTINIVPVYDVSFGQVLVLDRQESYRAQISFGTSIIFTVHLRVSVPSWLVIQCFYWQQSSFKCKKPGKLFSLCSGDILLQLDCSPAHNHVAADFPSHAWMFDLPRRLCSAPRAPPSPWHHPACPPATCPQESWRWQTAWMAACLSARAHCRGKRGGWCRCTPVCFHAGALMPVAGVGSCVRGEVTRFPLSRGVCRGSYRLKQQFGWKPFTCLRTPVSTGALTPSPQISLALKLTAGSETMWENGEVTITFPARVFSDACRSKCCAFVAGMSATRGANRDDSCWQRCFKW